MVLQAAALTQWEYVKSRTDAHGASSARTLLQTLEPEYCACEVPVPKHQDYCTGVDTSRPAVVGRPACLFQAPLLVAQLIDPELT